MEKKFFEEPSVQKVEFEFNERIAASGCIAPYPDWTEDGDTRCMN